MKKGVGSILNSSIHGRKQLTKSILAVILLVVLATLALNAFYIAAENFFASIWAASIANTILAIGVVVITYLTGGLSLKPTNKIPLYPYLFGPILCCLALTAACLSSLISEGETMRVNWSHMAMLVCVVPVIEEIIFRFGVSKIFVRISGEALGRYFSIVLFTAAHSLPFYNVDELWSLSLPVGPLFLAIICEYLMWRYNHLALPIVFHSCANLTPFIFSSLDARWLNWLSMFYLQN